MQRTIKYILILFIAVSFTSCTDGASLQKYYVDNQEAKNFISQDFPLTMIEIDKSNFTKAQNDAYNSVKKINFLGYKANKTDNETLKTELAKVETILSNGKYNDLMEFNDKGNKVIVKYLGDEEIADEVIVFGNSKELGFGIVRVLGDDMNPSKMVTLIEVLQKSNIDESKVQDIMNFFK
ncbi:hypothetical protein A8C32_00095 [Flavivirga aquatica]|uniref:DUF4252 domain-containing protein n=1 Tax=Flavivirga aquatica TaxID=1849968 RepID=A0A1E5TBI5_9FLAO|nr:DUF4252 domain-containing protein [Flavivirga aquatica]OEK08718.1 hypothetical protein A8C32_00095 [Flavivirga aquatica]